MDRSLVQSLMSVKFNGFAECDSDVSVIIVIIVYSGVANVKFLENHALLAKSIKFGINSL